MRETVRGKIVNGWQIALDMGRYGTNYTYRAGWTFYGVGGNLPEDAVYPFAAVDADGKPFNGAGIHAAIQEGGDPAGQRVLVVDDVRRGFLFRHNPLNRYALGDRSHLRRRMPMAD